MPFAFEAVSLSKTFSRWWSGREVRALDDVSFTVETGGIFGLLGPNGAGKTTLVKVALAIAHATRGEVRLLGEPIRNRSILSRIGYLPENPRFPSHLTAWQVLRLYGSRSRADMRKVENNASRLLDRLDLGPWGNVRVAKFLKGMNKNLASVPALVLEPYP